MKKWTTFCAFFFVFCFQPVGAEDIPAGYTELLDYVQLAPDQGATGTCLFVASTGAMELIANKKHNIRNPKPYGTFDLAESYIIKAKPYVTSGKYFWEIPVLKFNRGYGIHINDWPFEAWVQGNRNQSVWNSVDWENMNKVSLPKVETIPLFVKGNRWSTGVLEGEHISMMKRSLWKYKSPLLVNYNDNGYWHVVLIVGYDDNLPGDCYQTELKDCEESSGSFYVRDSFGLAVEVRDYDWFRIKGNAAFVVREIP
jgi:hypothetical protein